LVPLIKNSRNLASLFHSLCQEQNVSLFFPIACALFAQNCRVYPNFSYFSTASALFLVPNNFHEGTRNTGVYPIRQLFSETENCELPTDDYFLNRSIGLRHAGHWLAPSEAEGSLVTGHCLCYNSARRGTCREASPPAFASRFGRGPIRLFPVVFVRVAGRGRFALLSPVLAEARISPVQTHLQSVRLLHVLRGLRLSAAAPLQSSVNPRRQSLI